jgi:hypothetical protein
MHTKYTILRVWKQTAQTLKILAAMRGESMIALLDRLIAEEWARTQNRHPVDEETVRHD